ncbi:MAG: poly(A) polymerase [Paracoccaceae bacterium]|jgi:poly(A) polymerase
MGAPDTVALFNGLTAGGASLRFVGGCVRDAMLGRDVRDIDLATDLEPARVIELLGEKKIRAVPTGVDHGTITAIPDQRPFEITTLRQDVETDGRRAEVKFTTDWAVDAARRDFTINALSADPDGTVYDYVDGLTDLRAGRVRFIGAAADRIAEDYLRILRFFRFHATYASTVPDAEAVQACREASGHVEKLSGERVWQELSRILVIGEPMQVFALMEEARILRLLFPVGRSTSRLQALAALEGMVKLAPEPIRRLTALIQPDRQEASQIATRLRLSRAETSRLDNLSVSRGESRAGMPELALRRSLYTLGVDLFQDLILLDWADQIARDPSAAAGNIQDWKDTWDAAHDWTPPEFPVTGEDIIAGGVAEGPEVGDLLEDIEDWWIEQAFRPDRDGCLERLRMMMRRR